MIRHIALVAGLALGLAACKEDSAEAPSPPRPVVSKTVEAATGFGQTFLGTISARNEADLAFPIPGTMAERPVQTGALVETGDVLALIDPTDFETNVRIADASVKIANARLSTAQDSLERARTLVDRGVDSARDLEQAEQSVTAAQAAVDQADANGVDVRKDLENATMQAPHAGVISLIYEDPGTELIAGQPVLRLSGTGEREVLVDIAEDQQVKYPLGAEFVLVLDANRDVTARGFLSLVDPVANSATRTRQAHLQIVEPPVGFRLGALVRVTPASIGSASVSLPQTALRPDGTVWVVQRPQGIVQAKPVKIGEAFGSRVLVTDGLAQGDEVVVKGVDKLSEGQKVGKQIAP